MYIPVVTKIRLLPEVKHPTEIDLDGPWEPELRQLVANALIDHETDEFMIAVAAVAVFEPGAA